MKLMKADFVAKGFDESMAEHLERNQHPKPPPMTPERILRIAAYQGLFQVSLRYRDDRKRGMCEKLRRQKLLSGGRRDGKVLNYYITEAGRSALNQQGE